VLYMKKIIPCCLLLFVLQFCHTQELLIKEISKTKWDADHYIGTDSFGAIFYIKNNTFYKVQDTKKWQYNNLALGKITDISIVNPLKIVLFYEQSNSVVLLDKFLNEIKLISFNTLNHLRLITQIATANNSNLWLFDSNTLQLEIFDYTTLRTLYTTQPLPELPIAIAGNFNDCWLLTTTKAYKFNSYGSLLTTLNHDGYTALQMTKKNVFFKKKQHLYTYPDATEKLEKINLPEIPIKQFYGIDEILYIYDGETIYNYQLDSP